MKKTDLIVSSIYTNKYYVSDEFKDLPDEILEMLKNECIIMCQKTKGIFSIGFYEDGSVFLEVSAEEDDPDHDEELARQEVEFFKKEKIKLLSSLRSWYLLYRTENGKKLKEDIINNIEDNNENR